MRFGAEDRKQDIINLRATANKRKALHIQSSILNISYDQSSGHMRFIEHSQQLLSIIADESLSDHSSNWMLSGEENLKSVLIVDDMGPISDSTSTLRQYYETLAKSNIVRTLDEYDLGYTPCVTFSLNQSHEHLQYRFETVDESACIASWGKNPDGTSARPKWKAGYFVVSEYLT
jgi:hypothetical protein